MNKGVIVILLFCSGIIIPAYAQSAGATIIIMSSVENSPQRDMTCKSINSTASLCTPVPYTSKEQQWLFWWPIIWTVGFLLVLLFMVIMVLKN